MVALPRAHQQRTERTPVRCTHGAVGVRGDGPGHGSDRSLCPLPHRRTPRTATAARGVRPTERTGRDWPPDRHVYPIHPRLRRVCATPPPIASRTDHGLPLGVAPKCHPAGLAGRPHAGEVALSDPRRPIPELTKIVDEVIDRLARQTDVRLPITLQVEAEHSADDGFADDTVRTISLHYPGSTDGPR